MDQDRGLRPRGRVAVTLAVALTLALSATALAAHPKAGHKYSGVIVGVKTEGFSAPVRFAVSSSGLKVLHFLFGSFGCSGAGGFKPGVNPYTGTSLLKAGAMPITSSGTFSTNNSKSTYRYKGKFAYTTVTSVTVNGKFVTPKHATGTITISQTTTPKTGKPFTCHSSTPLSFTARTR